MDNLITALRLSQTLSDSIKFHDGFVMTLENPYQSPVSTDEPSRGRVSVATFGNSPSLHRPLIAIHILSCVLLVWMFLGGVVTYAPSVEG